MKNLSLETHCDRNKEKEEIFYGILVKCKQKTAFHAYHLIEYFLIIWNMFGSLIRSVKMWNSQLFSQQFSLCSEKKTFPIFLSPIFQYKFRGKLAKSFSYCEAVEVNKKEKRKKREKPQVNWSEHKIKELITRRGKSACKSWVVKLKASIKKQNNIKKNFVRNKRKFVEEFKGKKK